MADDFVLNVRQIAQYPQEFSVAPTDRVLLQQTGIGGPYVQAAAPDLVGTALELGGFLRLAPGSGLAWNGASLVFGGSSDPGAFFFSEPVASIEFNATNVMTVGGNPVATIPFVEDLFGSIEIVNSVNGRSGNVVLQESDILQAGAAPIQNAHFGGFNTSPTPWDFRADSDQIATTAFVQLVITQLVCGGSLVSSFNGRGGAVTLLTADVNAAYAVPGPPWPTSSNPALGDASSRIATTLFVDDSLADLQQWVISYIASGAGANLALYAPLASPAFTGVPTAPTAALGDHSGTLATTAFVAAAVTASTTGVASWNTRTGAVVLTLADITAAGGAPIASPTFTGVPAAPTAVNGTNTTQLATCAFVLAELTAGSVASFNTRIGAVTLTLTDITNAGGAAAANAALTGLPTAPTAAQTVNNTQIATTAYVRAAIAAIPADVLSFNGRTGVVTLIGNDISAAGGALLAAPAFTGVPTAPTAAPGTNTTQLATTAFVEAATAAGGGVASFNGRTGVVTLSLADITGAGGAPVASPTLTGVPLAPQAALSTSTNQLATCSFVMAQLAAGITSFNGRTGAVVLTLADVTGVGGAPLASPTFTGTPQSTSPVATDNSTRIATTAYTLLAITANAVASFMGRTGAVNLLAADLSAVGGALLAGPAFTGAPTAPTATAGTTTTQLATTQFVMNALAAGGGVTSFNTRTGAVTLSAADLTAAGGALLAGPTFTGVPAAPTAAPGTSTTQLATTAFVQAAAAAGVNITVQVFIASGTYTPHAGMTYAQLECIGGGGGGGSTSAAVATNQEAGGGGGSGGYSRKFVTAAAVGASQAVTIGTAGAGAATGAATAGAGGATSVGTLCVANGGSGGGRMTGAGVGGAAGAGAVTTAAVGDVVMAGNAGGPGLWTQNAYAILGSGGSGGGSALGGGAAGATSGAGVAAAANSGGGGSGALSNATANFAGGAGGSGIVIITEYW